MLVATATTTTTAAGASAPTLEGYKGVWVLVAAAAIIIITGILIIWGRGGGGAAKKNPPPAGAASASSESNSIVRSWIAVALVSALILFCAASFVVADTSLRSTLFGGLVASVGAAVAFYFASKSADQARHDILSAALGTSEVPNLIGKSIADARTQISETGLVFAKQDPSWDEASLIKTQTPDGGTMLRTGSKVTVTAVDPPVQAQRTVAKKAPEPTKPATESGETKDSPAGGGETKEPPAK
jgi:PASTA domain